MRREEEAYSESTKRTLHHRCAEETLCSRWSTDHLMETTKRKRRVYILHLLKKRDRDSNRGIGIVTCVSFNLIRVTLFEVL